MRNRVLFIVFLLCPCIDLLAQQSDLLQAKDGLLNAADWDITQKLPLNGYWTFYDHQLCGLTVPCKKSKMTQLLPEVWNETNSTATGTGFCTYTLDVLVPSSEPMLALELPQMYCSYNLWINGQSVASNGRVGKTPEETLPEWRTQVVTFKNPHDTIHLTLQIANFHHYLGGLREPIYLATPDVAESDRSATVGSNLIEVTFLALEAVLFAFIFLFNQKKRAILYFALLCLSWSVRSAFSNIYLATILTPGFDWEWVVRIEYITLFSTIIFGILFLHQLFKNVTDQIIKYLLVSANFFFIAFTVFSSPLTFTRWLPVYIAFSLLTLLYGAFIVVRALSLGQEGVWYLVVCILLGIVIFSYDVFSYKGVFPYSNIVMNGGYILLFLLTTVSLLLHLNIIKNKTHGSMLTYEDLYQTDKKITKPGGKMKLI